MPIHSRTDRLWYTHLTEYDSYETEHIAGNHEDEFPRHNDNQLEPDTADYRLYDPIYRKGQEQTTLICGDRSQHGGMSEYGLEPQRDLDGDYTHGRTQMWKFTELGT